MSDITPKPTLPAQRPHGLWRSECGNLGFNGDLIEVFEWYAARLEQHYQSVHAAAIDDARLIQELKTKVAILSNDVFQFQRWITLYFSSKR